MSDKALSEPSLTWGELELTQKMQRHFPKGKISPERLHHWSNGRMEDLTLRIEQAFQEPKFEIAPEYLPIWRKFRIGGLDVVQLQTKLKEVHREVSEWGDKLLSHEEFKTSSKPQDVFFAKVNLAFLGFRKNPRTTDWLTTEFFADWSRKHLQDGWVMELCEVEDGPSIGYQYTTQPNGEILWVPHKPVVVEGRAPVWHVERSRGGLLWLRTLDAHPLTLWNLGSELLLRLRRVQPLAT